MVLLARILACAGMVACSSWADSLLLDAASRGDLEQVRSLLAVGANPNSKDGYGATPLMLAISREHTGAHLAIAELLLQKGTDPNVRDKFDRTALILAMQGPRLNTG